MAGRFDSLAAPPAALEKGGTEILRAAIVEGGLHVSLQRGFDDYKIWGLLLADVVRHVARIFETEEGKSQHETIAGIRWMFDAEFDRPTDLGTTTTR
jgi:hypothetical protein